MGEGMMEGKKRHHGETRHLGEIRNLVICEMIPDPKPHSLKSQTTLFTALPAPTLGLVSALKLTPSLQPVSPPQPGGDICSVKTPNRATKLCAEGAIGHVHVNAHKFDKRLQDNLQHAM